IARETPLSERGLWDGTNHGFYQGIILCSDDLSYVDSATDARKSALDETAWRTLWQYEAVFGVRQVTTYTNPQTAPADEGLRLESSQDPTTQPVQVTLTPPGQQVFPYLRPSAAFTVTMPPRSDGQI